MANIKISELEELTTVDDGDVLPIVDISSGETKKVKSNKFNQDYFNGNKPMGSIVVDDIRSKNLWSLNSSYSGTGYVLSDTDINIPAGTYTISFNKSVNSKVLFDFKDSSNQSTNVTFDGVEKQTVTFPNDKVKVAIYIYGDTSCTISNIQIEKGSTATNYSEYKKLDTDIYSFDTNLTYNSASSQSFQNAILKNAKLVVCNFHSTDGNWDIQTQHLTSGTSFTSMQTSTNWYVASNFDSTLGKITFLTKSDNSNFVLNKITVVK